MQPPPAAAAAPAAATPAAATPAAAAPAGETLSAKVNQIKTQLALAPDLSVVAAIREANTTMELATDGLTLHEQADRLLATIG